MTGLAIVSVSFAFIFLIAPCKGVADNDTETVHNKSGNETHVSALAMASLSSTSGSCIARLDERCWSSCGAGATCSWGKCYCNLGNCAGVDERCHSGSYRRLPGTYRISNSRWPDYFIKMNARFVAGFASVTKKIDSETEFFISVVHGPSNGGLAVLITSVKWPDHALAMIWDHEHYRLIAQRLGNHAKVEDTAFLLYRPPESSPHPNATMVMIRGIEDDKFAYVPPLSWDVFGGDDNEGAGMYWYIDPPLPEILADSMQKYTGDRCEWDCGAPLIGGAMDRGQFLSFVLITISAVLAVGMTWMFDV